MGCAPSSKKSQVVPSSSTNLNNNSSQVKNKVRKIRVKGNDSLLDNEDAGIDTCDSLANSRFSSAQSKSTTRTQLAWLSDDEDLDNLHNKQSSSSSAKSKNSKYSTDSGCFDDPAYAKIITENGQNKEAIDRINREFKNPNENFNMEVTGHRLLSGKERRLQRQQQRGEEKDILENLRNEGLIQRCISRAAGGYSFEIVSDDKALGLRQMAPPARLAKLGEKKGKKKVLTEDDIRTKLEKAERRRKNKEQQKIEKAIQQQNTNEMKTALDNFAQLQKSKEESVAENRDRLMKEKLERLRRKEEHAEKVRQRKLYLKMSGELDGERDEEADDNF